MNLALGSPDLRGANGIGVSYAESQCLHYNASMLPRDERGKYKLWKCKGCGSFITPLMPVIQKGELAMKRVDVLLINGTFHTKVLTSAT